MNPGIYRSDASSGCYWERKRSFLGSFDDIIDNDFMGSAGQARTEVRSNDLGFQSDSECGTWVRDQGLTLNALIAPPKVPNQLEENRAKRRQKVGVR